MGNGDCCGGLCKTNGIAPLGGKSTTVTSFAPMGSLDNAEFATTEPPKTGIQQTPPDSPYWDIVADLMLILHYGKDATVDETPMLSIAAFALEHELASRMLDEAELAGALAVLPH